MRIGPNAEGPARPPLNVTDPQSLMNNSSFSPFEVFRRNLKPLMVLLTGLALFAFVALPALQSYLQRGGVSSGDPVVARFDGRPVRRSRVAMFTRSHQAIVRFLRELAQVTIARGGAPGTPGFQYDVETGQIQSLGIDSNPGEQASIRTMQFSNLAQRAGFELDDAALGTWLELFTDGKLSDDEIVAMLMQSTRNQMGQYHLYDQLRHHLLADLYQRGGLAGLVDGQMPVLTPAEQWQNFLKLNRQATINAYGVLVADYLDQTNENPTQAEIQEVYEAGKDRLPNDQSPEPAFRRPTVASFEYVSASLPTFIDREVENLSEEQLRAEYQRRREGGEFQLPEDQPAQPTRQPAPAPQAPSAAPTTGTPAEGSEAEAPTEDTTEPADALEDVLDADMPAEDAQSGDNPPAGTGDSSPVELGSPANEPAPESDEPAPESDEPAPESDEPAPESEGDEAAPSPDESSATKNAAAVRLVALQADDEQSPGEESESEAAAEEDGASDEAADASELPAEQASSPQDDAESPAPADPDQPASPAPQDSPADSQPEQGEEQPAAEESAEPTADDPGADAAQENAAEAAAQDAEMAQEDAPAADTGDAGAAGGDAEADEPQVESFEDVREQIADELARPEAQRRAQAALEEVQTAMRRYFQRLSIYQSNRSVGAAEEADAPERPDLQAMAQRLGLQYDTIKSSDEAEIQQQPIGNSVVPGADMPQRQAPSFVDMMYGLETQQSYIPAQPVFSPLETQNPSAATTYVSWKTDEREAYTPPLEEVREDVVEAIRHREARELARAAAKELAEEASQNGAALAELIPEDRQDQLYQALGPFSWLNQIGFMGTTIGNVPQLDSVGPRFMREVFSTEVGQYGVAPNQPERVFYVVQPTDFQPPMEELRQRFKQQRERMMALMLGNEEAREIVRGFYESVDERTGFEYLAEDQQR